MLKSDIKDNTSTNFGRLEESFRSLESLLGISITVIDKEGSLRDASGNALFGLERHSHQKNPICREGFCRLCVEHCRYEMFKKFGDGSCGPMVHKCWKGAMEMAVPVRRDGSCIAIIYGGIWRDISRKEPKSLKSLPSSAALEYARLPVFDKGMASQLGKLLDSLGELMALSLDSLRVPGIPKGRREFVMDFIRKGASSKQPLKELSAKLGLSPSRAGHLVKELFGMPLETLILEERMGRARKLLAGTELSIGEIAELSGFPDRFSFGKIFRRMEGRPPGDFRNLMKPMAGA